MKKTEYRIDLKGVRSARALHARLDGALPFPEGYGRNLDALYDFLTEHGPRMRLVFSNARTAPASFRRVCADAVASAPGLEIVFA
ncbi:MAG: barstar family protein [Kiritimatiellae bacterium]|nr:barstar family protein [Kiritimatiellia bacterium]